MTANLPNKTPANHQSRTRQFLRWTERVLAVIGLCFVIYHLGFELTVMTSGSMAPALQGTSYSNGDRILVEKITGRFRTPKRWEVYFLYDAEGTPVAKRIVGLPGEKVGIKGTSLYINGFETSPPQRLHSLKYYPLGNLSRGREVECGNDYFVLGDDSQDSYDSRYLGPVTSSQLRGRAWCILWPFSRVGFVN
jgi:signal peptidase I